MIIDEALAAERPQPGMPLLLATDDAVVRKALLVMQQWIDAPLSVGRVARTLGVSSRKLERHFREALEMTPSEADRLIRVEQAKYLLRTTDRSATRIAADTGFCDLPHLIRVFRATEGVTPDGFSPADAGWSRGVRGGRRGDHADDGPRQTQGSGGGKPRRRAFGTLCRGRESTLRAYFTIRCSGP